MGIGHWPVNSVLALLMKNMFAKLSRWRLGKRCRVENRKTETTEGKPYKCELLTQKDAMIII